MAISPRAVFTFVFVSCVALLLFAIFYLQEQLGLEPCPMCILQRYAFIAAGLAALAGAIDPRRARVYGWLILLFALVGAGVAIRHTYITYFPPAVASCGADMDFLLGNFPLAQALPKIFAGTGDCSVVKWRFLGLSIPEWSIVWFVIVGGLGLWVALRRTAARS